MSFDYKCIECKTREERFVSRDDRDNQYCKKCQVPMIRVPHVVRTDFKFNDK